MNKRTYSTDEIPLCLRVEDLEPILGIGRSAAYALARSGQLRTIKVGKLIRIPREAVLDLLTGKTEEI